MELTLLVENNSLYDRFFYAEHGMSSYILEDGVQVLYDTGYSSAFIQNAQKLGIDLTRLDYVVISHGHYDHAGGLKHLMNYYREKGMYRRPTLILGHEDIFLKKFNFEVQRNTGMDVSRESLDEFFDVRIESRPFRLTDRLYYLGNAPRRNTYECRIPQNKKWKNGAYEDDFITEDAQLGYKHGDGGLSILTGCSHSGICNIIGHGKQVMESDVVHNVLGGLHLQKPPKDLLDFTLDYVQKANIENFYACHCTDFNSRLAIGKVANICETGVSMKLTWA